MIQDVPGGWCIETYAQAWGVMAFNIIDRASPLNQYIGHVLTRLQGGGLTDAAKVQQAIDDTLAADIPGLAGTTVEAAEYPYASWKPNAILLGRAALASVAAAQALGRVVNTRIPNAQNAAQAFAQQGLDSEAVTRFLGDTKVADDAAAALQSEAVTRYNVDLAILQQLATDIGMVQQEIAAQGLRDLNYTDTKVQQTTLALDQAIATVQTSLDAVINALATTVGTEITNLTTATQAGLANLQQEANAGDVATYTAVVGDLNAQTQSQLAAIWPDLANGTNADNDTLTQIHPDTAPALQRVLADVPVSIPVAIGALAKIANNVRQATENCTLPDCQNLGNYGKNLQSLLSLIAGGLLLAFIIAMLLRPEETARDTVDLVGGIVSEVHDAIRSIFG